MTKEQETIIGLYTSLKKIAKHYQTPSQLRRASQKQYGLEYEEALEYAYENIQLEAAKAIKGVRLPKEKKVS